MNIYLPHRTILGQGYLFKYGIFFNLHGLFLGLNSEHSHLATSIRLTSSLVYVYTICKYNLKPEVLVENIPSCWCWAKYDNSVLHFKIKQLRLCFRHYITSRIFAGRDIFVFVFGMVRVITGQYCGRLLKFSAHSLNVLGIRYKVFKYVFLLIISYIHIYKTIFQICFFYWWYHIYIYTRPYWDAISWDNSYMMIIWSTWPLKIPNT